jgi:spermidine synthase
MTRTRRGPPSLAERTDFGLAELAPEADRPGCWTLFIDGQPHSHVDTAHPEILHFEYMQLLAIFADIVAPHGVPLRVLHLGGGAMSLARYIDATRPRSAQLVIEHDTALTAFVRRVLPLPRRASIRVRQTTAKSALETLPRGRFDLVLADFPGLGLARSEFVSHAKRILDPRGIYAANIVESPTEHIEMTESAFGNVSIIRRPKRSGNTIVAARKEIPLPQLHPVVARMAQPLFVEQRFDLVG